MAKSKAFYEGATAGKADPDKEGHCPYQQGTNEWADWFDGYNKGAELFIAEAQIEGLSPEELEEMLGEDED
jgi:ribosome modulation factor